MKSIVQKTIRNVQKFPQYAVLCIGWAVAFCFSFSILLDVYFDNIDILKKSWEEIENFYELVIRVLQFGFTYTLKIGTGFAFPYALAIGVGAFALAMVSFWFFIRYLLLLVRGDPVSGELRDFTFTSLVTAWLVCTLVVAGMPLIMLMAGEIVREALHIEGVIEEILYALILGIITVVPVWVLLYSWYVYPFIIIEENAYPIPAFVHSYRIFKGIDYDYFWHTLVV